MKSGESKGNYSLLSNSGGGDCGVYAVIHAIHGKHNSDAVQAPIIRGQIADVMSEFVSLHRYRQNLESSHENSDPEKIIDLYRHIFNDHDVFKFVASSKLKAPLDDPDTNVETRANLERNLGFLEGINGWEELLRHGELVRYIFSKSPDFGIDVDAAIGDHNSERKQKLDSNCTPEEYHAIILQDGE